MNRKIKGNIALCRLCDRFFTYELLATLLTIDLHHFSDSKHINGLQKRTYHHSRTFRRYGVFVIIYTFGRKEIFPCIVNNAHFAGTGSYFFNNTCTPELIEKLSPELWFDWFLKFSDSCYTSGMGWILLGIDFVYNMSHAYTTLIYGPRCINDEAKG